ncbi:NADAR family protein, partial [Salmonella enterica]|uniref:NADAR family protein n=1 Tax=Salmonella enterica TaxID=28901 RepID=UPI0032B47B15
DWIMYQVVSIKVSQHSELLEILLATEDAMLIEHTKNDRYWADGGDGSGKNMLGKIIMVIRREYQLFNRSLYGG